MTELAGERADLIAVRVPLVHQSGSDEILPSHHVLLDVCRGKKILQNIIFKSHEPCSGTVPVPASLVSSEVSGSILYLFVLKFNNIGVLGLACYLTAPVSSSAGEFLCSSWPYGLGQGLSRELLQFTTRLSRQVKIIYSRLVPSYWSRTDETVLWLVGLWCCCVLMA